MSRKKQPIEIIRAAETPEQREKLIRKSIIDRYCNMYNNGDPRRAAQLLAETVYNWIDDLEKPSSVYEWLMDNVRANGEVSFISNTPSDIIYAGAFQLLGEAGGNLPEEMIEDMYKWATGPASRLIFKILQKITKYLPTDVYIRYVDDKLRKRHGYKLISKDPVNHVFKTAKK